MDEIKTRMAGEISQSSAKNILKEALLSDDKKIISISGGRGTGKTTVFKSVASEIEGFGWIYGKCTSLTQLTAGGLIQEILFNLFMLPNFCICDAKFKKNAYQFLKGGFSQLKDDEISDLINFLYPEQKGNFEDLSANKVRTYALLDKVFEIVFKSGKFIFVVDNLDFIDGFSYEFLRSFTKKENVYNNLKMVLIYNEPNPGRGYFYFPDDNIYADIRLNPAADVNAIIESKVRNVEGFVTPEDPQLLSQLGFENAAFAENALMLQFESMIFDRPFELPKTFGELIRQRLQIMCDVNPLAYEVLIAAAILGDKINLSLLSGVLGLEEVEFFDLLNYLEKSDFIEPLSEAYYEFKSLLLWETICNLARYSYNFENLNRRIYAFLGNFTLNSSAVLGLAAQNLQDLRTAFDIWTKNIRFSSYIGDVSLYSASQKQCLALLNEFNDAETIDIRFNIHERLGKLLSSSNPKEAMDYLPDAIEHAKETGNQAKEIELLSYMASCCQETGNYFGSVECVDSVLEKTNSDDKLNIALLNTTKLQALLNIGNCGEIINLIDNTIMPAFEEYFTENPKGADMPFIFENWMRSYLVLANALVLQGSGRVFDVINILFDIIERYKITDELFICKCKISLACAHTIRGSLKNSDEILGETLSDYKENIMDAQTLIHWNLLNIVNRFIKNEYEGINEELFNVAAYANNAGDSFTKNILKTLLGKIFRDNGQDKQAMDIYNEQIGYFAKEKMAVGALLTWYLIAEATLAAQDATKASDIAERAFEVAQNPKVDNYIFSILLRGIIARAAMVKSDFDTAKIHIEAAIALAKQMKLSDLLAQMYLVYGDSFRERAVEESPEQKKYLEGAAKMYELAANIASETENSLILDKVQDAQNFLRDFCKINGIN